MACSCSTAPGPGSHHSLGGHVRLLPRSLQHGGILSNGFIKFWWDRQVITNQYGRPDREARNWGPNTIEGNLSEEELAANRQDQPRDNAAYKFRDEPYYASKEHHMGDIQVPLLSVANWGGICLHVRGNVEGWTWAGSERKFLRFITGRHDLPFYYHEEVEVQRSLLDAFLKGEDRDGWSTGQLNIILPSSCWWLCWAFWGLLFLVLSAIKGMLERGNERYNINP